jgi:hypothetical protein
LVLVLGVAAPASASPAFGVEATRAPAIVHRNDEYFEYQVKVKNTASSAFLVGEKLTCNVGTWTGAEPISFSFQWLRDGAQIGGENKSTHIVAEADKGHSLQCRVTAANAAASVAGASAPVVVSPVPAVTPPFPLSPGSASARPVVQGTGTAKRTCIKPTGWGPGAPNEPTFSFQWLRNGTPIAGASTAEYTPGGEDANKVLQCLVTAVNVGGSAVAVSAGSVDGTLLEPPSNAETAPPSVSGPNWSTGAVSLAVILPAGLSLGGGSGSGWSCHPSALTCTNANTLAPGAEFAPLKLEVWVNPAFAPEAVNVTFDAFGGGAVADTFATDAFSFAAAVPFGFTAFTARAQDELGNDYAAAGGHPFSATTTFKVATHTFSFGEQRPAEYLRDLFAELPPGFVGNLASLKARCTVFQVREFFCPPAAAVGGAALQLDPVGAAEHTPIYNVIPEKGYVAAFAFAPHSVSQLTVVIRAKLRSSGDYGITAQAPLVPEDPQPYQAEFVTLCGFGTKTVSKEHPGEPQKPGERPRFEGCLKPTDAGASEVPFLTNPTQCSEEASPGNLAPVVPTTYARIDSWQHQGATDAEGFPDLGDPAWKSSEAVSPATTGCNQLEFDPSFEGRPTTKVADAPAGLNFHLHVPQPGLTEPDGLGSAHLKDTTVVLPEGLVVNPSAANGLAACSSAQIGLKTAPGASPIHFTGLPAECPAAAKIGTAEVQTPLLNTVLHGSLYLAKQYDNPFESLLATYLVIEDEETGIIAKLAGKVSPDPVTGRLTVSFDENPQVPFSDLSIKTFEGPQASLRTSAVCGPESTQATFTPWSAPESGPPVSLSDAFQIAAAPGGGPCPTDSSQLPNAPRLSAGTVNPTAGAYSPFVLRLSREDGSQELKGIETTLPPGLTARLAGVGQCSEAEIARAEARSKPGEGTMEQEHPSCPASSEVGEVLISAGAGPAPFHTQGRAYLAGPYKGAPISLVIITPAVAGPFDLGTVVNRSALFINPVTATVSVKSDPIPTILAGIPLDVRSIEVRVSRNQFMLNPTSCNPMSIGAAAIGTSTTALLTNHFQVGECGALRFKPGLKLRLHGATSRGAYQRLEATVSYPKGPGYANIASASVALPHSEFLAQEHIRTVCTRVQFAAHQCPLGSVYGEAEATTPLLDYTLRGPVYLRSSSNPLPDLVAALRGPDSQPIEIELSGRTDSFHGGIRNTFDLVPDAPVSRFTLRLFGGQKSLIVNSRNLCGGKQRATVRLVAQNGLRDDFQPVVENDCKRQKKPAKHGHDKRHEH